MTGKVSVEISAAYWESFKRWSRTNLSSFEISYSDLHQMAHFMECSTAKDGTGNCLVDISTIMDAKEFPLSLFFHASPRIAETFCDCLNIIFFSNKMKYLQNQKP